VSQKTRHSSLRHSFGKCWSIFEILSLLDTEINLQRDLCYISHRTFSMSLHYLAKLLLQSHSTFSKSVMMLAGVSKFGKTNLIFVDRGVKINETYYRDVSLTEQLLSVMCEISGEFFVFQQDSDPAHRPCKTISLLEWETPAFILPDLRLPTIQIWARLTTQSREKCSSGSARRKFVKLTNWSIACYVWRGLEQSVISDAINEWCIRGSSQSRTTFDLTQQHTHAKIKSKPVL